MKRLQVREPVFKGEITAFLALIFMLMLSMVGALFESASIQVEKSRMRADVMLALESTFAEYQKELLEEYEVFARFGCEEDVLKQRLQYYGATGMAHSVVREERLTDHEGAPFYRQAVRYMKNYFGLDKLSPDSEYDFSKGASMESTEQQAFGNLESLFQEYEVTLPNINHPIQTMERLKSTELLTLVAPDIGKLSNQSISLNEVASARALEKGNYENLSEGASDKLFFIAYVDEHFSDAVEPKENKALLYEQEYLLEGCKSDRENLTAVCEKILFIRMASNYTYLQSDSTKKGEAEFLAAILAMLVEAPPLKEPITQAILLAWAYGESIVDVRVLLKEKRVPLVKSKDTWQLQLSNLGSLGTSSETVTEKSVADGLCYGDYLKGLFLLENKRTLSMRSLDLIEKNLNIQADQCMTRVEIKSTAKLRRGINETFTTTFGYQ